MSNALNAVDLLRRLLTDFPGVDPTGVADSSAGVQAAIDTGDSILIPEGTYKVNNLTQDTNFQQFIGIGRVHFEKNANGPLLTSSGDDTLFRGIDFRDTGSAYTGKGLVSSGDRVRVEYCGGYLIEDTALEMTGGAVQVIGTCNIWRTRTGAGYDISIGVSGTATLYHRVQNIYTSAADGGIRFIDCGGQNVVGSQFGKLSVTAGTSPVGVNGGMYVGNRILGAVEVELSSAVLAANQFSAINIHFASGTSGHRMDESNVLQAGATIDDDSNESYIVDTTLIPELQSYTPTWVTTGTQPTLGNGTLVGWYTQQGRRVFFTVKLTIGSTTTVGTGTWSISLPAKTLVDCMAAGLILDAGTNHYGAVARITDSTPNAILTIFRTDVLTNAVNEATPMAWATGDQLTVSGEFYAP